MTRLIGVFSLLLVLQYRSDLVVSASADHDADASSVYSSATGDLIICPANISGTMGTVFLPSLRVTEGTTCLADSVQDRKPPTASLDIRYDAGNETFLLSSANPVVINGVDVESLAEQSMNLTAEVAALKNLSAALVTEINLLRSLVQEMRDNMTKDAQALESHIDTFASFRSARTKSLAQCSWIVAALSGTPSMPLSEDRNYAALSNQFCCPSGRELVEGSCSGAHEEFIRIHDQCGGCHDWAGDTTTGVVKLFCCTLV